MKPFAELSSPGQLRRMRRLVIAALENYGLQDVRLTLLAHGHNHVYRVTVADAGQFVLRVQNEHRLNDRAAQSQHLWLEWLNQAPDLVVPEPVRLPDGALT